MTEEKNKTFKRYVYLNKFIEQKEQTDSRLKNLEKKTKLIIIWGVILILQGLILTLSCL